MFHSCFYNTAAQREINENNHSQEHGKYYFGHYYKRNTIEIRSNALGLLAQPLMLLLGDRLAVPEPFLHAA